MMKILFVIVVGCRLQVVADCTCWLIAFVHNILFDLKRNFMFHWKPIRGGSVKTSTPLSIFNFSQCLSFAYKYWWNSVQYYLVFLTY